jgi:DNA-3-methyladenine glycosylase I
MDYHDNVWGVPEYDDIKLFEFLNLEGAQAGLSWYTVLIKKDNHKCSSIFRYEIKGYYPERLSMGLCRWRTNHK